MPHETISNFYRSESGLIVPTYTREPGSPNVHKGASEPLHPIVMPEQAAIEDKLKEIAQTLRVIEYNDQAFEIAVGNAGLTDGEVMLHISTYSSSISTNSGNAYELAVQSALYPNFRHVYVASFGNGATSPLLPEDASYARKTGRFTQEIGDNTIALPSLHNLHAALEKEKLAVTNIMGTDSAGGPYARAYALTLENDQLESAFFSEVSGVFSHSVASILYGMLIQENIINAKLNKKISPDSARLDSDKVILAQTLLDKNKSDPSRLELLSKQIGFVAKIGALLTSLQSLRRGPKQVKGSSFVEDTNALLAHHPHADITYGFAELDPLYDPEELKGRVIELLGGLAVVSSKVTALIIPGMTHAYNTHFPTLYHAIQQKSLNL